MKLQELIKRIRFVVNEVSTPVAQRTWSDDEIVVYINAAIQDMFIQQVEANESYHNVEFSIQDTSERVYTIGSNITAYTLPYLVHRINNVRLSTGGTNDNWGRSVPVRTMQNRAGTFWTHDGLNRIRIFGVNKRSVLIEASKIPARLTEGSVPDVTDPDNQELAPTSTTLCLRHSDSEFEIEEEADAYVNAVFEVTGTNSSGHLVSGQRRRCTKSEIKFTNNGAAYTRLTMDFPWETTPRQGDTWTMLPEAPETHMELIVLKVAEKCWRRKPNPTAQAAIQQDLLREELRFKNAIELRQAQTINQAGMDRDEVVFSNDPDRITGRLVQ